MRSATMSRTDWTRRLRDGALVVCVLWLVVQNAVLIVMLPWEKLASLGVVAEALIKAFALLATRYWAVPAAATLAVACALYWLSGRIAGRPQRAEVRHG